MALDKAKVEAKGKDLDNAKKLQANLAPKKGGLGNALSPGLSFLPDPQIAQKSNSTEPKAKPTQMSIKKPEGLTSEIIPLAAKAKLQYRVAKCARDFAPAAVKKDTPNESGSRNEILIK